MKITKRLIVLLAIATLAFLALPARSELPPDVNITPLLNPGGVALLLDSATNAPSNKIIPVHPGQNVVVTFNTAAASASTANQIAYFKYRCGDQLPWSSDVVGATKSGAGTANVVGTATLYYGTTFPSNTTSLLFVYLTNASHTVTHYHSNLWATTIKPK